MTTRAKAGLTVLALSICTLLPPATSLASFSVMDGKALDPDSTAVHFRLGVPTLGADYVGHQQDDLDFGFGLLVNYLSPYLEPSLVVRWQIDEGPQHNLGLVARAGLHWNMGWWRKSRYPPNFGVRLTPAAVVGLHSHPSYSSYFLVEAPFLWTWGYGGGFAVPVRCGAGFEFTMTPDTKFVMHGALGPRFEGGGGHVGGVFLDLDIWMGVSMRMF